MLDMTCAEIAADEAIAVLLELDAGEDLCAVAMRHEAQAFGVGHLLHTCLAPALTCRNLVLDAGSSRIRVIHALRAQGYLESGTSDLAALPTSTRPTAQDVWQVIAGVRGVGREDLASHYRGAKTLEARHSAVWLLRHACGYTLMQIARYINRDHTTIISSLRWTAREIAASDDLRRDMADLIERTDTLAVLRSHRILSEQAPALRRVVS